MYNPHTHEIENVYVPQVLSEINRAHKAKSPVEKLKILLGLEHDN